MVRLFCTISDFSKERAVTKKNALHDAAWRLLAESLHAYDDMRFPAADVSALPAIRKQPHGKPVFVEDLGLHFSLSHSGDAAVCALCDETPVGVDVQETGRRIDMEGVSRRFFHPAERTALAACADDTERRRLFFLIFSCKEAYVKMSGDGLSADFTKFCVDPGRGIVTAAHGVVGYLSLHALAELPEYALALCTERPTASAGLPHAAVFEDAGT